MINKNLIFNFNYHHVNVLPAFAVIAELATSEAKRTMTVPFAEGVMIPIIVQILLAVFAEAVLEAAGKS